MKLNNKFLIMITFMSSLAYGVNYNVELVNAITSGNLEKATEALKNGANINALTSLGLTPLFYAIMNTDIDMVNLLLQNGADVNIRDNSGHKPLYDAIRNRSIEIVKILLSVPTIVVDKSDLEYAKQQSDNYKRKIEAADAEYAKQLYEKAKAAIDQIGRMLIRHLGLYTGQSGISKQGITGVHDLPAELAKYIAAFGNN